jgi:hypothetical protein
MYIPVHTMCHAQGKDRQYVRGKGRRRSAVCLYMHKLLESTYFAE